MTVRDRKGRMRKACVLCRRNIAGRPRGLCFMCYYSPRRYLVPADTRYYRKSEDFDGDAPLPEPTTARPNTPEKVAVMQGRVDQKQCLFHPEDAIWEVD